MKERVISVTEAARNFADCVNRVRYLGLTFILQKNGVPVAKVCERLRKRSAEVCSLRFAAAVAPASSAKSPGASLTSRRLLRSIGPV